MGPTLCLLIDAVIFCFLRLGIGNGRREEGKRGCSVLKASKSYPVDGFLRSSLRRSLRSRQSGKFTAISQSLRRLSRTKRASFYLSVCLRFCLFESVATSESLSLFMYLCFYNSVRHRAGCVGCQPNGRYAAKRHTGAGDFGGFEIG